MKETVKELQIDFKEGTGIDLFEQKVMLPAQFVRDLGNLMYTSGDGVEAGIVGTKVFMSDKNKTPLLLNFSELEVLIRHFIRFQLLGQGSVYDSMTAYLNNKLKELNP